MTNIFNNNDMRDFISLVEEYSYPNVVIESDGLSKIEEIKKETSMPDLFTDLRYIIEKLRAHMENGENEDINFGVEEGMQRAAEMIENCLKRYQKEE